MKISVFGLGYVGAVTTACLANEGFEVIGVDPNSDKIDKINKGNTPIIEEGLEEKLNNGVKQGRIYGTQDYSYAIHKSDITIISVGTPTRSDGAIDLTHVKRVCQQIGKVLKDKKDEHSVFIRSTVLPGTSEECKKIIDKESGKDTPIAFNPEFLREGSAINDFYYPPFTIIGAPSGYDNLFKLAEKIYKGVDAPFYHVDFGEAELVKYASNAWHATKIAFANEIGRVAKNSDLDSIEAMNILIKDRKLNVSEAYMKPGFAYGGSCLPKDVRALEYYGKVNNISLPLLQSLAASNDAQIDLAMDYILEHNLTKVLLLGLAFKSGTDDLRESPGVKLAERLLGKGIKFNIYDPAVNESKLIGSNKAYVNQKLPHLSELMITSPNNVLEEIQALIVTHNGPEFESIIEQTNDDTLIYDLSGTFRKYKCSKRYEGIVW